MHQSIVSASLRRSTVIPALLQGGKRILRGGISCLPVIGAALLWASQGQAAQLPVEADTWTSSVSAGSPNGTNQNLSVIGTDRRAWLKFDLSTLPGNLKAEHINRVTLRLFTNSVLTPGQLDVYAAGAAWTEGALTHSNAPSLLSAPGSSDPYATAQISAVDNFVSLDVTELVCDWLDGTIANHGIVLKANAALSAAFDAKENASKSHVAVLDVEIGPVYGMNGTVFRDLSGDGAHEIILTPGPGARITIGGKQVLTQSGAGTFAVGENAVTEGGNALAIGDYSYADRYGIAFGVGSSSQMNGIAIGFESHISGSAAYASGLAFGHSASASSHGIAVGSSSEASGDYSIAIGVQPSASGLQSIAIGYLPAASGEYSIAIGRGSSALGWRSMTLGQAVIANGANETVIGRLNAPLSYTPEGNTEYFTDSSITFTIGNGYQLSDSPDFVVQNAMTIRRDNGAAIGTEVASGAGAQVVVGRFNDPALDTDALFVVGTGTAANAKKNAFVVKATGEAEAKGNIRSVSATGYNKFKAPILVPASGDISMGEFEEGEQP